MLFDNVFFVLSMIGITLLVATWTWILVDRTKSKKQRFARKPTSPLAAHFGKLKRGLDGMEYQKMMRNDQWS
ncbi:MAG: hypothetical protein LBB79_05940 [Prevotellaceae bacterium]|jgi:hypothetical protein|nr:hypothetical protein [Prevotellaceae bacterium]